MEETPDDLAGTITRLLRAARAGDVAARDAVYERAYLLLQRIASAQLRATGRERILQATALVNQAYARLSEREALSVQDRREFIGLFSRAIHHELIDHIRAENAKKRGGGQPRELFIDLAIDDKTINVDIEALRVALNAYQAHDPDGAEVVRLRFFMGLSMRETADTMGCTLGEVRGHWRYARSWLLEQIGSSDLPDQDDVS